MTAVPIKRILQWPCWCGPATLAMMLSQFDIDVDQRTVGEYADAIDRMDDYGTRPDELALAVRRINPELRLWAKRDASLEDIDVLINTYKLAVGIEWQGDIFFKNDDAGHFSVVTAINLEKKTILVRDPEYEEKDRRFRFKTFLKRWFDTNLTGSDVPEEAKDWMDDYHMLFVIGGINAPQLETLGLKKIRVSTARIEKYKSEQLPLTLAANQKTQRLALSLA